MKKSLIIGLATCFLALAFAWVFKLWMFAPPKNYPALPSQSFYSLTFTQPVARIPCLQVEIEGISFLAQLDLGYDGVLSLPRHILEQLTDKSDAGITVFMGIKGKKYETPVFTIPKLYIEDLALVNFPVEESSLDFERDISLRTNIHLEESNITARIGWQAFLGTVLLIDFNKSVVCCSDSLETLKEKGYPLEQFIQTNLLTGKQLIEFKADIDHRSVTCLLDTGSTLNLLNTYRSGVESASEESDFGHIDFHSPSSNILSLNGRPLGPCIFHNAHLPLEMDAIIGIDFLETQIICIDFINSKLYLFPSPE